MITLSRRQKQVFDFLWTATLHGTRPWTGWLKFPDIPRQTVLASVDVLAGLGAISLEATSPQKPRIYRVLVSIYDVEEATYQALMGVRCQRWNGRFDRHVEPDSGAFLELAAKLRLPAFENDPRAPLCEPGYRPQLACARAL